MLTNYYKFLLVHIYIRKFSTNYYKTFKKRKILNSKISLKIGKDFLNIHGVYPDKAVKRGLWGMRNIGR